tara:strand:- start:71 stop:850 length:780 start_codon:yes stop_codon:yes gene_type:complete
MKIIILAAGEGTRLRPYTNNIPKCMVEFAENSLLSHQLNSIGKCEISSENIALVGGYRIEALKKFNLKTFCNSKYDKTNMVETLFCAKDFMTVDDDLIISYGDIIYEERVLKKLINEKDEINIIADKKWETLWRLRMAQPLNDAETFIMDDNQLIKELGKKPTSLSQIQAQYIGLIKVKKDLILKFIQEYNNMDRTLMYDGKNFNNLYMTSFIQHLIDSGWKIRATIIENGWLEVDTVEDLKVYQKLYKQGLLRNLINI